MLILIIVMVVIKKSSPSNYHGLFILARMNLSL